MRLTRPRRLATMALTAVAVLALTVSGVIAQACPGMLQGGRVPRGSVVISGDVLHQLVLVAHDLNALPRQTVQVTYLAAGVREHHVFRGPRLIDVIAKAHPLFDSAIKNDQLRFYVSVTGSDGYRVVVAYGEIDPKFEGKDVLLATTEDGRSLDGAGPRLVVPGDKAGGRYVSGVASVQLGSTNQPDLTVSAADALTTAFTEYGTQFSAANVKFSFAGAAELAMQIQQGARPDVFASSNTSLPNMLHAQGLVSKPVVFAADRLVIAVPAGSTAVRSLADLAKPGVTIAIGSASTPVGSDALTVLSHLPAAERSAILANVAFTGMGGSAVVKEVASKGVDAGFLLGDDVASSAGNLIAVQLPNSVKPQVAAFGVAIVKGSKHRGQAQAFINGLLTDPAQQDLIKAGFVAPSKP